MKKSMKFKCVRKCYWGDRLYYDNRKPSAVTLDEDFDGFFPRHFKPVLSSSFEAMSDEKQYDYLKFIFKVYGFDLPDGVDMKECFEAIDGYVENGTEPVLEPRKEEVVDEGPTDEERAAEIRSQLKEMEVKFFPGAKLSTLEKKLEEATAGTD